MLKSGGKQAFVCWRALENYELDRFPLVSAGVEQPVDEALFSFADSDHVSRTRFAAGFADIAVKPQDQKVSCGDVDAMAQVLLKVGPLGKIIRENPDCGRWPNRAWTRRW